MRRSIHFLFLLSLLLLSGCLEIETTVRVHEDGSIERTLVIVGDSSALARGEYPMRIDTAWQVAMDTAAGGKKRLTAHRIFSGTEEMNIALKGTPGKDLQLIATLEREFDWFYTIYRYRETWLRFHPFTAVPITEYLSDSEVELLRQRMFDHDAFSTRGDSLALEDIDVRFEQWRLHTLYEHYWEIILNAAERRNVPASALRMLRASKDSLYTRTIDRMDQGDLESVGEGFRLALPGIDMETILKDSRREIEQFEALQDFEEDVMKHDYSIRISMPGILLDTNAPTIEGSTAVWQDYIKYSYLDDTALIAESRVLNWWMVVLMLGLLLLLVGLAIITVLRRRSGRASIAETHSP